MDWVNTTRRLLTTRYVGRPIEAHEWIDSTNTRALELVAEGGASGTVVVADQQSEGRGRFGRVWQGGSGTSLLMSVILRPAIPKSRFGLLPLSGGIAVLDGIESFLPATAQGALKWPNDVLVDGKKCAGILVESIISSGIEAAMGIGVNVNQEQMSAEVGHRAVSLRQAGGRVVPRPMLFANVLEALERRVRQLESDPDALVGDYSARLEGIDRPIQVRMPGGPVIRGTFLGVDPTGALTLLSDAGGRHTFTAGEVTLDTGVG